MCQCFLLNNIFILER